MKFSREQELAIKTSGKNLLVSAGAGSGKTAVLTERIMYFFEQGYAFKDFLVLTFTEAAAMEMKIRTRQKLLDKEEYKARSHEIEDAHIETFDAFFLYIVKRYAYLLGISSDISIIDKSIVTLKKKKVLKELIEERILSNDEDFLEFVYKFCDKTYKNLEECVLKLDAKANKKINKKEYLDTFVDTYYSKERAEGYISSYFKEVKDAINEIINLSYKLEDARDADKVLDVLNKIDLTSYDTFYNTSFGLSLPSRSSNYTDTSLRDYIKDTFNTYIPNPKRRCYGYSQDIINNLLNDKKHAEVVVSLVKDIDERINKYMKSVNCYTFNDVASMALSILKRSDVQKELKEQFKLIFVDEYQDTSDIQDAAISLISDNNVFMVGDVKQSIYRFRDANPVIFQTKFNDFKKGLGGDEIDLNNSYRSRREVVDFINETFDVLMAKGDNPINYKDGHKFGFGQVKYDTLGNKNDYVPEYIDVDNSDKRINERVINLMADDIISKVESHYQVYDKELDSLRDCLFKDFAIIVRSSTHFEDIKTIFTQRNIPVFVNKDAKLDKDHILYLFKSLCTLISCIYKDEYESAKFRHAFASIARSFAFEMSDEEIYTTIRLGTYKDVSFIKNIVDLREKLIKPSIYEILFETFNSLNIIEKLPKIKDYNLNASKIEFFFDIAHSMDMMNLDIEDFATHLDEIDGDDDLKIEFKNTDVPDDAVTVITIHKSKGLEYPICYFPYLWVAFQNKDAASSFVLDDSVGLTFVLVDDHEHSPITKLIAEQNIKKENYYEEIRLFYVALTRAREKIIMYGKKDSEWKGTTPHCYMELCQKAGIRNVNSKYYVEKEETNNELSIKEKKVKDKVFEIKSLDISYDEVISKRASKQIKEDVNADLLAFGQQIHYLLEIADYETKNTSFIKDEYERKIVDRVLKSQYFKDVKNDEIRHEFEFFDELNGVHGVIDCLIIKEDRIDIIDFKLKNISDINYDKQLKTYKEFIRQIEPNKPIRMILLAALDGESREIDG